MAIINVKSSTGETYQFEIAPNANLQSSDPGVVEAIQYDRAMIEFGEEPSEMLIFIDDWKNNPFLASLIYIKEFDSIQAVFYGTDCISHVSSLCSGPKDLCKRVPWMMSVIRKYVTSKLPSDQYTKIKRKIDSRAEKSFKFNEKRFMKKQLSDREESTIYASEHVISACMRLFRIARSTKSTTKAGIYMVRRKAKSGAYIRYYRTVGDVGSITDIMRSTSLAVGGAEYAKGGSKENGKRREVRWQRRRLVDVINALQAGNQWPALEATK